MICIVPVVSIASRYVGTIFEGDRKMWPFNDGSWVTTKEAWQAGWLLTVLLLLVAFFIGFGVAWVFLALCVY